MAGRGGRPWGPIRAESEEASTLAGFLRAQVEASGKTLIMLAAEMHFSKTRISDHLGGKVPDQQFVTALIRVTVPEPRLRERRLAEARKLLHAATRPSPVKPPPRVVSALELVEVREQQVEIYSRLTRSLEQQNQLREAAGNSWRLVMILLSMINGLERQITDLTGERDQLHAAHADPDTLRQTQQQLTRAQVQEERARHELRRAQEKQRQAEELAARVQIRVDQLTDELDRLRTGTADNPAANEYDAAVPGLAHLAMTTDPVADDIDQALTQVEAVNDRDDQMLQRLNHDLIQASPADGVVQDNPPNNPATRHELGRRRVPTGDKPVRTRRQTTALNEDSAVEQSDPAEYEPPADTPRVAARAPARSGSADADDASEGASSSNSLSTLIPDRNRSSSVLVSFGGTVPTTGLHGVQSLTPSVLVLNGTGKVLSEDYVLHPDHTKTDDGSVALLSDRERWTHDLPREQGRHLAIVKFNDMPATADRILFIVSVSAGASRMGALPRRSRAHAEAVDPATMRQLTHIAPPQFTDGYAAVIADLRREPTGWSFQAVTQSGLNAAAIARSYGARSYPNSMWF